MFKSLEVHHSIPHLLTMDDNQARTLSTVAVWTATTLIFLFVVRNFSWSDIVSGMFIMLVTVSLAIAPAVATQAIWSRSSSDSPRKSESEEPPKS